jgi:pimeloyl-ACP methyl ester carboxylesterase
VPAATIAAAGQLIAPRNRRRESAMASVESSRDGHLRPDPGAGGDGWQWHLVVRELEQRGHAAISVTLPPGDDRAGWQEYAHAVVEAIGEGRDLVLVAQSLAGFTAPLVCERLPVNLLVLLNAMIPRPGETGNDWWGEHRERSRHARAPRFARASRRGGRGRQGPLLPRRGATDRRGGFRERGAAAVHDSHGPAVSPPGLAGRPTRVIAGRDDRLFPLEFQRRIARERLALDVDPLPGGHMLALSQPRALADLLVGYLRGI